ncbi:MAG: 23S rRNA (uracil(1939)-C(5))-methyltransferase RlmD [Firmicutes bacterium]|nr:23S rRNA (uracil(1939)-C(5))-methyltransferase RlmD [Bacillota bacterium]
MKQNDMVELLITDMSAEGQGIGRAENAADPGQRGLVVFVADTVPGDKVLARLTKVKKNYAFGRVEEMLKRSAQRNEEFDCPYFGAGCGGCPMARLDYDGQLRIKEQQVRSRLERLAGLEDPVIRPIIGMEDEDNGGQGCFRYRGKAVFPVSTGGIITRKGGIVENLGDPSVGFYRAKSHEVVDCGDCYLQSMAAMAAADALRTFMEEDNITAFDPKWEKGLLRHLIVKTAFGTGEVMVILVLNGKGIPGVQKLVEMLDEAIEEVGYSLESVVVNVNRASGKNVEKNKKKDRSQIRVSGEILGEEYITIAGKPTIDEVIGPLRFEISPASFFQVNPTQMQRLYDQVRAYVMMGSTGASAPVILDLYCGVGSIGLYCADLAEMVVGIESVKEAVADANRNAVINGIVNARYLCGRAEELLPAYLSEDPARQSESGKTGAPAEGAGKGGPDAGAGKGGAAAMKIDPQLQEYIRRADIAILDPPRAGCRPELLEAVASAGVGSIIYVSCDPATLARDVQLLQEMGYAFVEATPVDMFPHTGHCECCSFLMNV